MFDIVATKYLTGYIIKLFPIFYSLHLISYNINDLTQN